MLSRRGELLQRRMLPRALLHRRRRDLDLLRGSTVLLSRHLLLDLLLQRGLLRRCMLPQPRRRGAMLPDGLVVLRQRRMLPAGAVLRRFLLR